MPGVAGGGFGMLPLPSGASAAAGGTTGASASSAHSGVPAAPLPGEDDAESAFV